MIKKELIITNETGLHARPATLFVQTAQAFKSKIGITKGQKQADAKSILAVMSLGITKGTSITLWAEGEDEKEAIEALERLVKSNFREGIEDAS
ncbi:MAG: phosphocarrier protein HPr [Moorella sp. (in: firmicutes)]|jgi:phosphocarrier protein|uniref:HPr family phosphocarrier protein n=1 Tax=unclassified Neomoorella TaxID=2676739 RepID=UPI0010FFAFFF|nr:MULTISPECIES: HPr family phosphocarrier protein [unclassified Moorella (in: firmicutes)]MDK2817319.1 phosphocarrier protein HPr [Moorella sp. (in: firmicutes)]GEA14477.1 hypothetical protein E308F_07190 [Moorella sp. E308F]GEA18151.1 hypothetical protein E306M_12870 [Moorella sp. E306M]